MVRGRAVYEFGLGDVEDPDLYARLHIGEWVNTSEQGQMLKGMNGGFTYLIDHDGSMDGGYIVTLYARVPSTHDQLLYDLTWPEVLTNSNTPV